MNRIHRKLEYALIALKHMNQKRPGELTTVKEICQRYGTPFDATARVLQQMVQGKFLKSEQGAYGGYLIMRDLTKVSLRELIEKVVGPIEMVKCMGDTPSEAPCEIKEKCNIMLPLISLNDKLVKFYENINVHELINTNRKASEVSAPEVLTPEMETASV